jgi:uncharacterized protein (TIGR03067 family)
MASLIDCPNCKARLRVANVDPVKAIKCPKCAKVFKTGKPETSSSTSPDSMKPASNPETNSEEKTAPNAKQSSEQPNRAAKKQSKKEAENGNGGREKGSAQSGDESPRSKKQSKPGKSDAENGNGKRRSLLLPLIGVSMAAVFLCGISAAGSYVAWSWARSNGPIAQTLNPSVEKVIEEVKKSKQEDETTKPPDKKPPVLPEDKLSPENLKRIKDATVLIHVGLNDGRTGSGSGFFVDQPGLICTNAHVLGMLDADSKPPQKMQIVLHSGEANEQTLQGKVLGVDRDADLAFLSVEANPNTLPTPLSLGDLPNAKVTQRVYILGYPFGDALGKQVTTSESSVSSLRVKAGQLDQIQVNGGIHPGNSGGPIVDAGGNLIGISVSIIRGTQINFAIPAQKVLDFMQAKVTSVKFAYTTNQSGKFHVPVRVAVSDPLRTIDTMVMQFWVGAPGPVRPGGNTPTTPLASDSPTEATTMKLDPDGSTAHATLVLSHPPTDTKVLWCQPILTSKNGQKRWLSAAGHAVPSPLQMREVNLTRKFKAGSAPILLTIKSTSKVLHGSEAGRTTELATELHLIESIKQIGMPETNYQLYLRLAKLQTSLNGKIQASMPRLETALQQASNVSIEVRADDRGNLLDLTPAFDKKSLVDVQLMRKFLEHVTRGLELASIPLTGDTLKPGQTWRGARLPTVGAMTPPLPHSYDLTYTYRGVRVHDAGLAAVIDVEGAMRKNIDFGTGVNYDGTLKGEALINVATGNVVLFDATFRLNHKVQYNVGNVNDVQETVEIHQSRGKLPVDTLAGLAGTWCETRWIQRGDERPLGRDAERWWIFREHFVEHVQNPRGLDHTSQTYRLRPEIAPNAIDFQMIDSENRGYAAPGIFEINGNILKICMSLTAGDRPTEYASRPNSNRRLIVLERVENGAPRTPIHVAKVIPAPNAHKDDPNLTLLVDPAPSQTALPCIDLSKGIEVAHTFRLSGGLQNPQISPDGKRIACRVGNEIICIDTETRQTISSVPDLEFCHLAWSPDAKQLACLYTVKGKLVVREMPSLKEVQSFEMPKMFGNPQIAFTPGGRYVTVLHPNEDFQVWDIKAGKQVRRLENRAVRFDLSSDGKQILFLIKGDVIIADFATLKEIRRFKSPFIRFDDAALSPDNRLMYVIWGKFFEAWDRSTGKKVMTYNTGSDRPEKIWSSADNQFLVVGTGARYAPNAVVFRVGNPDPVAKTYVPSFRSISHTGRVVCSQNTTEVVLYLAKIDSAFVAKGAPSKAAEELKKIPVLDAKFRFKNKIPGIPSKGFGGASFSDDDRFVVTASRDNKVHVMSTASGKTVKTFPTQFDEVSGIALSPNGSIVYATGAFGKFVPGRFTLNPTYIAKIDVASGKETRFTGIDGAFSDLKISPDGTRLYGIGIDYSFRVWDTQTGKLLHSWEKLFRVPYGFELARDGKMGLLVMSNGPIVLNLQNFRDGLKLTEGANGMVLLGNTGRAAASHNNRTLKIWDLKSGNLYKSTDLVDRDSDKSFGVIKSSADGKLVYIAGSFVTPDLYHVVDVETGKIVFRYASPPQSGGYVVSESGNLIAFRNLSELSVIELPPIPKR